MAVHLYTYVNPCSEKDLAKAMAVLSSGGVLIYPSDVNWAFATDPAMNDGLERIRRLKPDHPKELPFSLVCSSIAMAASYAQIEVFAYRILKRILPGPYTILLPRNHLFPRSLKDKRKTVGIRIPASPLILSLIEAYGKPLATSSLPTLPDRPLEFGYQIEEELGHGVDMILDLGDAVSFQETTILDLTEGEIKIVRLGVGKPPEFAVGDGS